MIEATRDKMRENLIAGAAVGLLALALAFFALLEGSRSAAFEAAALRSSPASVVTEVNLPSGRAFKVADASGSGYGVVFSAASEDASAIFAAVFAPSGELRKLKIVGSCSSRLPESANEALDSIAGAHSALEQAKGIAMAAAEAE